MLRAMVDRIWPKDVKDTFTKIWRTNGFGGQESVSGVGSGDEHTKKLVAELPKFLAKHGIQSVLDIPCGDFYWMQKVDLSNIRYVGMDIVEELISKNKQYESANIQFVQGNLIDGKLPKVDLIFCRDCLVHLRDDLAWAAIHNICRSESTYLLTTTFTNNRPYRNIPNGSWRPINFCLRPFSFPPPLETINEHCPMQEYTDKSLGLWRIADLQQVVDLRS